jgi:hypothetical protein
MWEGNMLLRQMSTRAGISSSHEEIVTFYPRGRRLPMPVLESAILESTEEINIIPRSALRHRPIATDEKHTKGTDAPLPLVQRASRPRNTNTDSETGIEVDEWEQANSGKKASGTTQAPRRRASKPSVSVSQPLPKTPTTPKTLMPKKAAGKKRLPSTIRHAHPLLYLGIGMLVMLALWTLTMGVTGWVGKTLDDIHYGYPRTYQTDAFVGHNETSGIPSHFIAINLHGHIEVIEFPGGDASHARIYMGPQLYTSGSDLAPATLTFADLNGDHLPDMIINVQGSQIVFINDQGQFRPMRSDELQKIQQALQHLKQ